MHEINVFENNVKNSNSTSILLKHVKRTIEALLFSTNTPLAIENIREIVNTIYDCKPKVVKNMLKELNDEYIMQQRAFQIDETAEGYIIRTHDSFHPYIAMLHDKRKNKLSQASKEVLAIIAYQQPITRASIENIRKVDSSGIIYNLLKLKLIEVVGKLEKPGRPSLYGVTKQFLSYFGLRSISDL